MQHILVDNDAVEHIRIVQLSARNTLDTRIPFRVNRKMPILLKLVFGRFRRRCFLFVVAQIFSLAHNHHGVIREITNEIAIARNELGANRGANNIDNRCFIIDIQRNGNRFHAFFRINEGTIVRRYDNARMNLFLQKWFSHLQHFTRENDDRSGAITNLFVLRSRQFNHGFRRWMVHINLSQDGIAIVGHHYTAHRIQNHFQHRTRTQCGAHNISHSFGCGNIAELRA
mmetsp:Transcript_37232/g.61226  ORF Transcript_37232/g.61226 Transcript_37232/m.61226 type:complete len:228 (-) Transcript_37232:95-778(-)